MGGRSAPRNVVAAPTGSPYDSLVRVVIAAAALSLAIGLLAYPAIEQQVHPPRCSTVESGGTVVQSFCIAYDPALGRYETPRAGVPADYGRILPREFPNDRLVIVGALLGSTIALAAASQLATLAWRRLQRGSNSPS